jgi:hypothetical protein
MPETRAPATPPAEARPTEERIVSVELSPGPGPLPHGVFEQAPRVIATLEYGETVELFSYYADERSFDAGEFVNLTVGEGRALKYGKRPPKTP